MVVSINSCLLLPDVFPFCSAVPCVLDELSDVSVEEIVEFELFVDSPTAVNYPSDRLACATPSARFDCFSCDDEDELVVPFAIVLFVPDDVEDCSILSD